jgi:hypothetical protein
MPDSSRFRRLLRLMLCSTVVACRGCRRAQTAQRYSLEMDEWPRPDKSLAHHYWRPCSDGACPEATNSCCRFLRPTHISLTRELNQLFATQDSRCCRGAWQQVAAPLRLAASGSSAPPASVTTQLSWLGCAAEQSDQTRSQHDAIGQGGCSRASLPLLRPLS